MADRYWVGGTANWDATAGTKWSDTSGGAGGFSVPTDSDNVFFDAASGTVTCTVTGGSFSSTATCANLNCTGFTGSITATSNSTLTCKGNLTLGASMSNFGFSGANFKFIGTGSYTITSNGILSRWAGSDGGLYLIGSCTVTLLDNFSAQRVTLGGNFATNIVFNLNDFNLILPYLLFPSARINLYGQSSAGPTLNFGTTGKIIVRQPGTGSTAPITIDRSSFGSQLFITGSKNVSVDISGTAGVLEHNYYVPSELALNWSSTAADQTLFNFTTVGDLDWSLGTGGIRSRNTDNYCFGNWNSGSKDIGKVPAGNSDTRFEAISGTKTITGTGTWSGFLSIIPKGTVTYNLGSNVTLTNSNRSSFSWSASGAGAGATLNTNGMTITTAGFFAGGGTCNLGTSTINSWANNLSFPRPSLVSFGSGVDASSATINAIGFSGRIYASNMTIGILLLTTTNDISIATDSTNLTFNTIGNVISPAAITFPAGVTTTVNNFLLNGTAGNLVTVRSTTTGTLATLSKSSGTVNVSYLDIRDSNATGGATWNSPSENGNVDSGNNQGWDFFNGNLFYFFTRKT